jgi:hypothetical protein
MCVDIIASVSDPVSTGEGTQVVPSLRVSAGAIMLIAVVWAVFLPLLSRLWLWSGLLEIRPKIEVQVWNLSGLCLVGLGQTIFSIRKARREHRTKAKQANARAGMTEKWDDPKLEALDVVREAMGKIYDAKRAGTATAKDDVRLKELHVEWMAIMRKIGNEGDDWRRPTTPPRPKWGAPS